jgi:murein DD-endopeptidase MepM/ murein hydrolase activator NlpD
MLSAISLLSLAAAAPVLRSPVLRSPVPNTCITSPFGARGDVGRKADRFHTGVDLRAAPGTWVLAAAAGRVAAIRRKGALGLEVDIRLPNGDITRYAHLGTIAPALASGRTNVATGERVGRAGRTGVTYGAHLHFELRQGGVAVDPAPYLGVVRCGAS